MIAITPIATQKQQHTSAQLAGQESLNSSVEEASIQEFPVPLGSRPHDVAPAVYVDEKDMVTRKCWK